MALRNTLPDLDLLGIGWSERLEELNIQFECFDSLLYYGTYRVYVSEFFSVGNELLAFRLHVSSNTFFHSARKPPLDLPHVTHIRRPVLT